MFVAWKMRNIVFDVDRCSAAESHSFLWPTTPKRIPVCDKEERMPSAAVKRGLRQASLICSIFVSPSIGVTDPPAFPPLQAPVWDTRNWQRLTLLLSSSPPPAGDYRLSHDVTTPVAIKRRSTVLPACQLPHQLLLNAAKTLSLNFFENIVEGRFRQAPVKRL